MNSRNGDRMSLRPGALFALACGLMIAACSQNADTKSAGFGDIAFATYEVGGFRVVFTTDTKAVKTWRNMAGDAVNGTYTKSGNEIEVKWDPTAANHGSLSEKFRQTGPCSITRYQRVDKQGGVVEGQPQVYQRTKPLCDTVRVTQ